MQLPPKSSAPGSLLRHGRYSMAALGSNPRAKKHAAYLKPAQTKLKNTQNKMIDADDHHVECEAVFNEVAARVAESLSDLQIELTGVVERDYDDPQYRKYFPKGLGDLKKATEQELRAQLPRIIGALEQEPSDSPLRKRVKLFKELHEEWKAPAKALEEAGVSLSLARSNMEAARDEWLDRYAALHGLLSAEFPRRRAFVESFFPKSTRGGTKKKAEKGEQPADGAPQP